MRLARVALPVAVALASFSACNGTTGDQLFTFTPYASGVAGAARPFEVNGFTVQLTSATMHVGAVYLDESPLATGAESPICINPDVYCAQVSGGVDVDLLSTTPQEFQVFGNGSSDPGLSWELWLTNGDVNEPNLGEPMVSVQGVATRGAESYPFAALVTINDNRLIPVSDPAQPGLNPLCKQRIVQVGGVNQTPIAGGTMLVTIDPRPWFNLDLDFSTLPLVSDPTCLDGDPLVPATAADFGAAQYCIPNTNFATGAGATQGQELFSGILTGGSAAYSVRFMPPD